MKEQEVIASNERQVKDFLFLEKLQWSFVFSMFQSPSFVMIKIIMPYVYVGATLYAKTESNILMEKIPIKCTTEKQRRNIKILPAEQSKE